ncbi:MAG: NAD-dependent epimerase/dehydratase family protein [Methanospirillaceae archaeon]|nr:NAD-dependent epimerase/dehydratase family protein [Methanospirillaceae archaeon]
MNKQVLITGGSGFLGRNVGIKFHKENYDVIMIGHGNSIQSHDIKFINCNVNLKSLIKLNIIPDLMIHCAGSGSVGDSFNNPYYDYQKNVNTLIDVLEYIRIYSPKTKLIFPSSAAVYGVVKKVPIKEDTPFLPVSPYGYNKMIGEHICKYYSEYGIEIAIIRFFSLYGVGLKKQLLFDVCKKISNNNLIFYGTGYEVRDFLHISDASQLIFQIAQHHNRGPFFIINGGTGIGTSVNEIVRSLIHLFGKKDQVQYSGERKIGDPDRYIADITKCLSLGWKPKINIQDGLKEYAEWFRESTFL